MLSKLLNFQPAMLLRRIKDVKTLKENTEAKFRKISENTLPLTDAESMRLSLKGFLNLITLNS